MSVTNFLERLSEVAFRLDIVEATSLDDGTLGGCSMASTIGTSEQ
jgi:hypothetical protein